MSTSLSATVIQRALQHRSALLKVISANDAGVTGSHQSGFLLPRPAWKYFAPFPPTKHRNDEHPVRMLWHDSVSTHSRIKWYGRRTRSEYRLTRFGRRFPFRSPEDAGSVLILIRVTGSDFLGYVLRHDEEIEDVQAALGVEITRGWALFGALQDVDELGQEKPDDCIQRRFAEFAGNLESFPTGEDFTGMTWNVLQSCIRDQHSLSVDDLLLRHFEAEYELFRTVEKRLCAPEVERPFASVEEFLGVANTILQRRKSRAGRSLENHVGRILRRFGVPFEARPRMPGSPDIVIPSAAAFDDESRPRGKLFLLGVKTTCRDRWRQVLEEGPKDLDRYLLTIQRSMSVAQIQMMREARITLVVPAAILKDYPSESRRHLLTVEKFIQLVRTTLELGGSS